MITRLDRTENAPQHLSSFTGGMAQIVHGVINVMEVIIG